MKCWESTENYVLAVPAVERRWGAVEGLPDPEDGVGYIVPMLVMAACPERRDLYSTDFGSGAVRNASGTVVGTRRLLCSKAPAQDVKGVRWSGKRSKMDEDFERSGGWWESR